MLHRSKHTLQSIFRLHRVLPISISALRTMKTNQQLPICGFVPAYILEKIAASDSVPEESRIACKDTLAFIDERNKQVESALEVQSALQDDQGQQVPLGISEAGLVSSLQRKIYDCKRLPNRPGTLVRSEGQARVKDRQINNCYDGFKITHDFFSKVFGRNSIDGKGLALVGSVHYKPDPLSPGLNNAFFDGDANEMVFGDGDDLAFDYFTDSLDVIAHELSHGFVQYSSPLKYYWQSGALNESVADVFACMVEQWQKGHNFDNADWIIGQTLFSVAFTGSALRTLRADKAYVNDPNLGTDIQPKHMRDLYTGNADYRGVHINSGIPNHAFYLAAKTLGGNSWAKVGKVWYKTMTSGKIPYTCDFATFAAVTIGIAEKESADGSVKKAVSDAWKEVGVIS